jgi:hypothetical protein
MWCIHNAREASDPTAPQIPSGGVGTAVGLAVGLAVGVTSTVGAAVLVAVVTATAERAMPMPMPVPSASPKIASLSHARSDIKCTYSITTAVAIPTHRRMPYAVPFSIVVCSVLCS